MKNTFVWMVVSMLNIMISTGQENDIIKMLEDQAVSEEAQEREEDLHQWHHLLRHPINLNTAGTDDFSIFTFLMPVQLQRLMSYRTILGPLKNVLELQAVPGWPVETIRKIAPYVTVATTENWRKTIIDGLKEGKHQLLTRMSMRKFQEGAYLGSSPAVLFRYQYRSRFLQFFINTEKDAGEQYFQKDKGISYLSGHLILYGRKNPTNLLIAGDYLVNMGQGLVHWQGRAVKKTGLPVMIKRQLPVVQPYRSNDENRYQRGLAIVLNSKIGKTAVFWSDKRIDANRKFDSLTGLYYVSSLINSGYHRTVSELNDKDVLRLRTAGMIHTWQRNGLRLGLNAIHHVFSIPWIREDEPYRKFAFRGSHMGNYSFDYYYTLRNVHVFGEAAFNNGLHKALVQGFMFSADSRLDMSLLFRKISRSYNTLQGNAFTESTEPTGEEGIYTGISFRVSPLFTIDAYADYYRLPWLIYKTNKPGWGKDFLLQATWKPDKKTVVFIRLRKETKTENGGNQQMAVSNFILPDSDQSAATSGGMSTVATLVKMNCRVHMERTFSRQIEWRVRVETNRVCVGRQISNGYLFFSDLFWTPGKKGLAFNSRIMYYESTDYASRIYAFENDVMYYNVISSFSGNGIVAYLNTRVTVSRQARAFLKLNINKAKASPGLDWSARCQLIISW